ncbi:hypothetical protein SNE40_012392 [Patella caerulea]|uniref:Homeobox domain-containing protein n=1 Tax=Patella caerulea TaxID=87958 RepID=A0AAN8JRF3_PATCE
MAYEGLQLNNVHVMQSSICRSTACCFSFPDKKRQRTTFSPVQVSVLEELFTQTQYPDIFLREKISQKISLCEARIQVWFQNRRARWRREFRKKYGNFPWPRGRVSSVYHGTQSTDVVLSSTAATTPEESLYSRTLLDLYARHKNE